MIITDATLKRIAYELETQNALIGAIAGKEPGTTVISSWEEVQQIVKSGVADKVFAIGEQLITNYTFAGVEFECPFDVVGFGHAMTLDEDGNEVDAPVMWLQQHYCTIEALQFDAPEPNNNLNAGGGTNTDVANYGYNRYSESGLRAWLNSSAVKGAWFGDSFERNGVVVPRRSEDVAPNQLDTYDGYMSGLDEDFLAVIKPTKVTTATNTVTDGGVIDYTFDKFFPLSLVQMHVNPQSAVEGAELEYYKKLREDVFPIETAFAELKKLQLDNKTAQYCWLRSAFRDYSRYAWNVNSTGNVGSSSAYYAYHCAPACAIVGI